MPRTKFSVILKNVPNTTSMVSKDWRMVPEERDPPKIYSVCSLVVEGVVVRPAHGEEKTLTIH